MDVEEGQHRRGGADLGERWLERAEGDIAERDRGEASPEPAPPAGEDTGERGAGGTAQAGEDQEEQVVWEVADAVRTSLLLVLLRTIE